MRLRLLAVVVAVLAASLLGGADPWLPGVGGPRLAHAAGNSIVSPDTVGDVGRWTSLRLDASGNPVVAYYAPSSGAIKLLHCGDPDCSSGNSINTVANAGVTFGGYTSLVLDASGFPVISYYDLTASKLTVARCNDANCAGNDETIVQPDSSFGGRYTSIELDGSGFPVVSYHDTTAPTVDLRVLHCGNATCTSGNTINELDSGVDGYTSLELDSSGNPVVSYYHFGGGSTADLKLLHCDDAACAAGGDVISTVDSPGDVGRESSLALDGSGFPVISYVSIAAQDLKVAHCNDANCSGGDESIVTADGGIAGFESSIALDSLGRPVISYHDFGGGDLKVLRCGNANCSSGNTIKLPDTAGTTGRYTSIALDALDRPVVSYYDQTNGDLKVLHCTSATCGPLTVDDTGDAVDANVGDGVCATAGAVCTLRAAIQEANFFPGHDAIEFNIAGAGPHTIAPGSALPAIVESVTIDGYSQPGASANTNAIGSGSNAVLRIELDGTSAGAGVDGLTISAGSSTVRGLVINRFGSDGIALTTSGNNTVEGNHIGTDAAGMSALGNTDNGVNIVNTPNNVIGGTSAAARNVISGNNATGNSFGITISGAGATGNVVRGNLIGTSAAGTAAVSNSVGLLITSADNSIGGSAAAARNVVSGNGTVNIFVGGSGATGNVIQGNLIGTNAAGTAALGSAGAGIRMRSPNNTIGGTEGTTPGGPCTGACNLISGGNQFGIDLTGDAGSSPTGNVVQGNFVGTNVTGISALGNTSHGIQLATGASGNTIGGTDVPARNVISGNGSNGIFITGSTAPANAVRGNFIGTNAAGASGLGNGGSGVHIEGGSASNAVGGIGAGDGNLIAFNGEAGVCIRQLGGNPNANSIRGNAIHSNSDLGIDLAPTGQSCASGTVQANDVGDGDAGPNALQNFPVLTSVQIGSAYVSGTINSTANTNLSLDFYSNAACDPSGNGEGTVYLGSTTTTTDGSGNASFEVALVASPSVGNAVTATSVRPGGATSEFSACVTATLLNLEKVAGTGTVGDCSDGTQAQSCALNQPRGLHEVFSGGGAGQGQAASGLSGALYWADSGNNKVKKVQPPTATDQVTTVAGGGGSYCNNCSPTATSLNSPRDVFIHGKDIYIADTNNCIVRRITGSTIATVAGVVGNCSSGGDGAATSTPLNFPAGVTVDAVGAIYIAERDGHRIRKVSGGNISTVAGTGASGSGGDGGPAAAAQLNGPHDLFFLAEDLVIADTNNNRIRRIDFPQGVISTLAGTGAQGYSGDGGSAATATFRFPEAVTASNGKVVIADTKNHAIRMVDALTGVVTTVADPQAPCRPSGCPPGVKLNEPAGVFLVQGDTALEGSLRVSNTSGATIATAGVDPTGRRTGSFQPTVSCGQVPGVSAIDWALPVAFLGLLLGRKRLGALSTWLVDAFAPRRRAASRT